MTPEAREYHVDRIFADFFSYLHDHDMSDNTIRGYRTDLEIFADWFRETNGKNVTLHTITPTDIRAYKQFLRTVAKQNPNTVNRKLSALFSLSSWAVSSERIKSSFTTDIDLLKKEKLAPRALTKQEEGRLLREAEELVALAETKTDPARIQAVRDLSIIKMLLNTGLRISELCDLDLGDVVLTPKTGHLIVRAGKGDKPGEVPLNSLARRAIRDWLAVRPKSLSTRLFISRRSSVRDEGITPSAVQRRFTIIGRRANVEVSPHDLRHTFATRLRERHVADVIIKELMRLETMEMVAHYSRPNEHDLEVSVDQLVG